MRTLPLLCLLTAVAVPVSAQDPPRKPVPPIPRARPAAPAPSARPAAPASPAAAMTEDDKALYAVGLSIWQSLRIFDLTPAEFETVKRGLLEASAGKAASDVPLETYGPKMQSLAQARQQRRVDQEKQRSTEYLAKAEKEPGAVKTESGLVYREITPGTGETPKPTDAVKVNYRGTLVDGTEFDSSYKRNEPAQFALAGVVKCWTEGLQKMKVGGKAQLVCPASIAYGDRGRPAIPGGATLIFEVELVEIVAPPAAAAAPPITAPGPAPTLPPAKQ